MKIAFFVQYCHEAGTYFRWHNLAVALAKNNKVDVYAGDFDCRSKSRVELRDGVRYIITKSLITSKIFGNPSDPFTAIYRWIKQPEEAYDVYHLFQPFLQAFLPWYRTIGKKGTIHIYDWDDLWTNGIFQSPQSLKDFYTFKLVAFLERKIPLISRHTTVCSTYLANKVPNSKIIYNGFWPKQEKSKDDCNIDFVKNASLTYLGYVGRTCAELDWLFEVAQTANRKNKPLKLVIVGPNKDQIINSGILKFSNVEYIESLTTYQAAKLMSMLDIGLLPLENNSFNQSRFPIKFFDYLTAGIPVYYSAVGELKRIGEGLNGAFKGGDDKPSWVNGLFNCLDIIPPKEKLEIDIVKLSDMYGWSSLAKQLEQLYNNN